MARKAKLPSGMWQRGETYYARFSSNGRTVRKRLSRDLRTAKELLNELRARADRGDFGLLDLDYPWTDLKAAFLRWAKQAVRHPEDYRRDLAKFEEFSNVQNCREVTAERIDAYRNWRLDQGVTPRTVNREVATINNMFNKGVKRFRVIDQNPIADVDRLSHTQLAKQRRPLTLEEVQSLFEHSTPDLIPVWRMFMTTGLRRGELSDLRFDDIDWARQTLTVQASNAKSKKAREIPLDDATMSMLVEQREKAADREPVDGPSPAMTASQHRLFSRDHVFVSTVNTPLAHNLLSRFYGTCRRAGIEDAKPNGSIDIHSLRVSFTTLSLEHGANPKAIQAILGHSTLALTMEVYAKATDRSKREAVSVLPFATASTPAHVVPMRTRTVTSPADSAQLGVG